MARQLAFPVLVSLVEDRHDRSLLLLPLYSTAFKKISSSVLCCGRRWRICSPASAASDHKQPFRLARRQMHQQGVVLLLARCSPTAVRRLGEGCGIGLDADFEALVVPLFQLADLPLGQQPPLPQHDDIIADELHVGQKMAGEEHAHILAVGQVAGQFENLLSARRVHAVGRLVENQQAGIVDQGRRQLQPLLHAGRIRIDRAVAGLAQADVVEDLMGPLQGIAARHAAEFAGIGHKIDPGNAGKKAFVLGHETHGLADIEPSACGGPCPGPCPSRHRS